MAAEKNHYWQDVFCGCPLDSEGTYFDLRRNFGLFKARFAAYGGLGVEQLWA